MAGLKHTFKIQIEDDAGRVVGRDTYVEEGEEEIEFKTDVPTGSVVVSLPVDVSQIDSFYIVSDKAVTLTENDDGTPDLTVSLLAGVPYWWHAGMSANPFSVDIVTLKLANAGSATASVHGAFLVTPA